MRPLVVVQTYLVVTYENMRRVISRGSERAEMARHGMSDQAVSSL